MPPPPQIMGKVGLVEYIHFGSKCFDRAMCETIKNREYFNKPFGGLWASAVNAKFGWKEWCSANNYADLTEENSFRFTLKDSARVWHIWSTEDANHMPRQENKLGIPMLWLCPDFERLVADGYDAVELHLSEETGEHGIADGLYFTLYGWDCDSILVLNPDIVEV